MRFEQHQSDKYLPLFLTIAVFILGTHRVAAEGVTDVVLSSGSFQIPFNIASGGTRPREVGKAKHRASGEFQRLVRGHSELAIA
jgi:hypothetical protein